MDTLVITPTNFSIIAAYMSAQGTISYSTGTRFEVPANARVWFQAGVSGTRQVNNAASTDYERIGFNFGGIEWNISVEDSGPETPVPIQLTPRTYIDAYGVLHLGPEVKGAEILITVTAKLVSPNPSGSGYELNSSPVVIALTAPVNFGNNNNAERQPYITYQEFTSQTPASGAGIGGSRARS